jgi:predicted PurR-regulated permease PerM
MLKKFFKRGSAEIVSVVLLVVVIGGLALGVSATLSKQTQENAKEGVAANTQELVNTYNDIKSQITH